MAVNANTKHPVECIKFLNLLNTDPEIRNLFNYGIEGVHYTLDEQGQVVPNTDKDSHGDLLPDAPASRYSGVQYTQGNWFILKTMGSDNPDPLSKVGSIPQVQRWRRQVHRARLYARSIQADRPNR